MEILALMAIVGLLVAAGGAKKEPSGPAADAALQAELRKLYIANTTTYSAVIQALNANMSPATLIQWAAQLQKDYPAISQRLAKRAQEIVKPVTGKSGTLWNTWSIGPKPDGWIPVDILLGAQPIISYQQHGSDLSTRALIAVADGAPSAVVARARQDFGV